MQLVPSSDDCYLLEMSSHESIDRMHDENAVPLSVTRQKRLSFMASFGFFLALLGLLTFIAVVGYRNEVSSASEAVRFQAALFSDETRIAFDRIDKVLDIIEVSLFTRSDSFITRPLRELLSQRSDELGFMRSFYVLAPNRQVLLHMGRADTLKLADKGPDYVDKSSLRISSPERNERSLRSMYFTAYREVLGPDGSLLYYAATTIDLIGFVNEMGLTSLSPVMRLSLFNEDGTLFVRSQDATYHAGKHYPAMARVLKENRNRQGVDTSPLDGRTYIYAFSRVKGFDMYAVAGRDYDAVLQPWKMELLVLGVAAIVLLLVNVIVLSMLEQNRRTIEEAQKQLIRQAYTDQLTGLLNRRAFMREADRRSAEAHRHETPLSLIVFDIDHFKTVNDSYGHDAGDEALRTVADIMREQSRGTDLLCRYGGEEFTLLLPQTPLDGARTMAEKLRKAISDRQIIQDNSRFRVTMSAGITQLQPEDTASSLFQRADSLLYQAKRAGRNRVVSKLDTD